MHLGLLLPFFFFPCDFVLHFSIFFLCSRFFVVPIMFITKFTRLGAHVIKGLRRGMFSIFV